MNLDTLGLEAFLAIAEQGRFSALARIVPFAELNQRFVSTDRIVPPASGSAPETSKS